jgi:peptide/nickel transport system permease protein
MRGYIRRLLLIIPTLFIVSIIVFLTVRLIPGDVIDVILSELGPEASEKFDREAIEHALGLDVPMHVQYGHWIGDILLHGSFGSSLRSREPILRLKMCRG